MSDGAYLQFLIVTVLVLSLSGLVVGLLWSLPDALRAYHYWRERESRARLVYSFWRLVRTSVALFSLACFLGVSLTALVIDDPASPLRMGISRHLILGVVAGLTFLVISEPISERRLDMALSDEQGGRDVARDTARDAGRDAGRDLPRDAARDKARDEWRDDND